MKKNIAGQQAAFIAAACLAFASSASFAAFGPINTQTVPAAADLTAAGQITFSITVKDRQTNATVNPGALSWTGVTLPAGWINADQYVQIDSLITQSLTGIRIVSDNTKKQNPVAPYIGGIYTGSAASAGGLIDNVDNTKALSLAWAIKDTLAGTAGPGTDKPYETTDGPTPRPNQPQWLFLTDVADTTLAPSDPYRVAINGSGSHFASGPTQFGVTPSPDYIYFEANFASAVTPRKYSTDRLLIESYHE